eukprot:scaffold32961_cov70-Cyclotella_meneghiniana.AAC.8
MNNQVDPNRQIERLRKQLEIANRRIANSNHQREANEKKLLESKLNEELSRKKAEALKKELKKTRERYATLEHDLQVNKLRNECAADRASIIRLQATINEINSDPGRDLPIKVDNKVSKKMQNAYNKYIESQDEYNQCTIYAISIPLSPSDVCQDSSWNFRG